MRWLITGSGGRLGTALIARLTADGHLDATFGTAGKTVTTSGPETELGGLAVRQVLCGRQ